MLSMDKLMNLFYNLAVSHRTATEHPLTGCVLDYNVLVCLHYVGYLLVSASNQRSNKLQGPNLGCEIVGNMGYPKSQKRDGFGGIIVGKMPCNSGRSLFGNIRTQGLRAMSSGSQYIELPKGTSFKPSKNSPLIEVKEGGRLVFTQLDSSKLIHAICHVDVLLLAYELIKSNPGNMTRGVSKETLDKIDMSWIQKTSKKLRAGQFQFGIARWISIPKIGKSGERPLNIASPREKIVQKAMTLVLTELFEPQFLDYSHSFRPDRSCHTALKMVDRTFRGGKWIIKTDLTKCFERISHNKLLAVLGRSITCKKTLALIFSGLKAGYINLSKTSIGGITGTPQGSILSPLLSNIYLHELDLFMEQLIIENTMGKARRKNPAYRAIEYKIEKAQGNSELQRSLRRKLWKVPSKDLMDPTFRRLAYVRYADDFVICITGPRKLAVDIKARVERFLVDTLNLELNLEKTVITKFSEGIDFLGATITNRSVEEKPIKLMKSGPAKGHLVRITPRLSFHAPMRKLIDKLVIRGYYAWSQKSGRAMPTAMRTMVNQDHRTILQLYNSVIRGLLNYYNFADNRKSLGSITHGLKWSCALTLALKYKLRTAAKVYKTFGARLACPKTKSELYIPDTFARLPHKDKFLSGDMNKTPEQIIKLAYSNKLTKSSFGKKCIICGEPKVEMHHVRKLRELRNRRYLDWFTMQMAAINRKQVPLCANHHDRLHNNSLSDMERKLFRLGCQELVQSDKRSK